MRTAARSAARPALVAVTLCGVLAAACSSDPWNDPAVGESYVPDPRTARRVGWLFEDAAPRLVSASGGASIACGGRTLWLLAAPQFGFGKRADRHPYAIVETEPADWPGSGGTPILLSARDQAAEGLPGDALCRWIGGIAEGEDVVLHYAATRPGPGTEPALDYLGTGVARLTADGLKVARAGDDWRFFDRGDPAFGMAVVQADMGVTTGFDYMFGVRGDAGTHRVYVARVPHGRGDQRGAYRFFAGRRDGNDDGGATEEWSADVAGARPLFRAGPGGLSVSWNSHLQAFLAVYSWTVPGDAEEPDRTRVLARASRRPEGPWSAETPLFEVRGPAPVGRVRVDTGAREHAEIAISDGRILFVSVDGGAGDTAPRMWRVELPDTR